jgi:hypothetical protein
LKRAAASLAAHLQTPFARPYHLFMPREARRSAGFFLLAALALAPVAAPQNRPPASSPAPVLLQPRFTPGLVMRYRVSLESTSAVRQTGLVQDPGGPAELTVQWDSTVRLEALPAAGPPADGALRMRITYEQSAATARSDLPEPRSDEIIRQYARLAGRSFEFTFTPQGRVSDIRGLEDLGADQNARGAVQQWMAQLSSAAAAPPQGVAPGQKWSASQRAALPLDGLSWRTDSTYLRNEPCRPGGSPGAPPDSARPDCAVILARLALVTTRDVRDPTPEDYRRNGLRTSGRWAGTGESLMYVSLETGWVVSSTQESTQEMDVTISGNAPGQAGAMRQFGTLTTRSQMFLLGDVPAPAPLTR